MIDDQIDPLDEAVRAGFRLHKPPAGLLADLVEFEGYYTVRLYRDNFDKLTQMEQLASTEWVSKTIQNILIVSDCYLEVWRRPGVPE